MTHFLKIKYMANMTAITGMPNARLFVIKSLDLLRFKSCKKRAKTKHAIQYF